jgi:hypothetical protein
MEFQRIDPGIKGYENRVFECGRCYTMKTVSVSLEATDAFTKGWVESSLRAPE